MSFVEIAGWTPKAKSYFFPTLMNSGIAESPAKVLGEDAKSSIIMDATISKVALDKWMLCVVRSVSFMLCVLVSGECGCARPAFSIQ